MADGLFCIQLQKGGAESTKRCNRAEQAEVHRTDLQKHLRAGMSMAHRAAVAGLCSVFMLGTDFSAGFCFQEGFCRGGGDKGWDKVKPLNPHPQTSLCRFFWGDDGWVRPVPNTFWAKEAVPRASVELG